MPRWPAPQGGVRGRVLPTALTDADREHLRAASAAVCDVEKGCTGPTPANNANCSRASLYAWALHRPARAVSDSKVHGSTGGCTGPPITSAVVRTTVPLEERAASHCTNAVKSASVIEYGLQWSQTWWTRI
jgi:hypothetical protein